MLKIDHIAIWTHNLETLKEFYIKFFHAKPNKKYTSSKEFQGLFESYFLTFDSNTRIEIMSLSSIPNTRNKIGTGFTHIAFSVEHKEHLDALYKILLQEKVPIISAPRITEDGYYETCLLDPDGNQIEITVLPKNI